jgi:protein ImuA
VHQPSPILVIDSEVGLAIIEHNVNLDRPSRAHVRSFCLGADSVDSRMPDGIAGGALHEVYGDDGDGVAAIGFAVLLALRADPAKPIVFVRDERSVRAFGRLYGSGVVELGGDPDRFVVVHTPDAREALRAAADAVTCSQIGSVIVEPWRTSPLFDLTASRRIALRAERSGVLTLVVRIGVDPAPSAAVTRWRLGSARSAPEAVVPENSAFQINLLRHRGGISGLAAQVEWDRDQRSFRDAPNPRVVPAVAAGRTCDPDLRRAA